MAIPNTFIDVHVDVHALHEATASGPTDTKDNESSTERERLWTFFEAQGADRIRHGKQQKGNSKRASDDNRPARSLADHLLGTFDLLQARACCRDVEMAGALHSVYGTDKFKKVTIEPNEESRSEIADAFGTRAERLAYLFHAIQRPACIENGTLASRWEGEVAAEEMAEGKVAAAEALPSWVVHRDAWDLRMIEAANLIDQGRGLERWPNIRAAWEVRRRPASSIGAASSYTSLPLSSLVSPLSLSSLKCLFSLTSPSVGLITGAGRRGAELRRVYAARGEWRGEE